MKLLVIVLTCLVITIAIGYVWSYREGFDATVGELARSQYNPIAATQTVKSLNRTIPVNDPTGSKTNAQLELAMNTPIITPGTGSDTNTTTTMLSTSGQLPGRNKVAAQASFCESKVGVGSCALLDDPAFSKSCGVCIKGGTRSIDQTTGEWKGGLYMDSEDRERSKVEKVVPQPSAGACPPGYFFVDRASCEKGVNRLECLEAGTAGGWNGPSAPLVDSKCAECSPGGPFLYDSKKRPFTVQLRCLAPAGTGLTTIKLLQNGTQIGGIELNGTEQVLVSSSPVTEGDALELEIVQEMATRTTGQAEVYAVGRPGYSFTQNTASMMCKSLGARLATIGEIEEAQSAGADWCASGHVSDGPPRFPIQVGRSGCGEPGTNIYGTTSDFRVATCYGIKPSTMDDYSATNTKIYPFSDQPSKRDSRFGRIARGVRGILVQWENTYDATNSYKMAIPLEGTVNDEIKRLGSFSSSGLISSPRPKDASRMISNQYWIWTGTGQKATFHCTVPATFLPPVYSEDASSCVGKPLITNRSSIAKKLTTPCSTGTPGSYSAQCLVSLFTSAGGDGVKGLLSPTVGGAKAVKELLDQGDQDSITGYVTGLFNLATTGRNPTGIASRTDVNTAAMKLFGFEIASPCEEIVAGQDGTVGLLPSEAPLSVECMNFLYKNAGSEQSRGITDPNNKSKLPATYTSIGDRYSGIRKGEYGATAAQKARAPFRTCTPAGTLSPLGANGASQPKALQRIRTETDGSISGIQDMFNRVFQMANQDGSNDTLQACFGITPSPLFKSNTVMFQSKNFPTRYITAKGVNGQIRLEEGPSIVSLRPGIAKGTIALGPVGRPNVVFRHSNFVYLLNTVDSTELQKQDSSFYVVKGLADPKGVSFKSYNFPDRYLRHSSFGFVLQPSDGGSLFQNDATFYIKDPPAPLKFPISYRPFSSNLLGTQSIQSNYRLTFDLTPNATVGNWASILHFTISNADCCTPGDRTPGFWFNPGTVNLHIRIGDNSDGNWGLDNVSGCAIGKTSRIVLECINSTVRLSIDKTVVVARQPTVRPSGIAFVYGGNPWYIPANVSVQNLTYQPL
jgi:hypothetical protein